MILYKNIKSVMPNQKTRDTTASRLVILYLTFYCKILTVSSFNLDEGSKLVFRGPSSLPRGDQGAYFGYSVGIQKRRRDNTYW